MITSSLRQSPVWRGTAEQGCERGDTGVPGRRNLAAGPPYSPRPLPAPAPPGGTYLPQPGREHAGPGAAAGWRGHPTCLSLQPAPTPPPPPPGLGRRYLTAQRDPKGGAPREGVRPGHAGLSPRASEQPTRARSPDADCDPPRSPPAAPAPLRAPPGPASSRPSLHPSIPPPPGAPMRRPLHLPVPRRPPARGPPRAAPPAPAVRSLALHAPRTRLLPPAPGRSTLYESVARRMLNSASAAAFISGRRAGGRAPRAPRRGCEEGEKWASPRSVA